MRRSLLPLLFGVFLCGAAAFLAPSSIGYSWTRNAAISRFALSGGYYSEHGIPRREDFEKMELWKKEPSNSVVEGIELKDYQNEASKMFESYRIPAMLISGAAYSGAFALPLSRKDSLTLQLVKKTHCVLGIATLLACMLTVILSTSAIDKITVGKHAPSAHSLSEYLDGNFEFEWVSVRANFIAGIFGFATMCGLRSFCFLTCPQFSRATRYA